MMLKLFQTLLAYFSLLCLFGHPSTGSLSNHVHGKLNSCSQLPPFLKTMEYGYDMRLSAFLARPKMRKQGKYPMIAFTCTKHRRWTNNIGDDEQAYDKPDQVDTIEQTLTKKVNFEERVYIEPGQFRNELARRAGLLPEEKVGFFAEAEQFKKYENLLLNEKKIVFEHVAKIHVTRVKLRLDWLKLAHGLEWDVKHHNSLPSFDQDPDFYIEILRVHGSHFPIEADFGSYIWQRAIIDSHFLEKFGSEWIGRKLKIRILKYLGGEKIEVNADELNELESVSEELDEDEEDFEAKSDVRLCYYNSANRLSGCTDEVKRSSFNATSFAKWLQAAQPSYAFLDAKMVSLEQLFEPDVQRNLRIARDTLFAQSEIKDIYPILNLGKHEEKMYVSEVYDLDRAWKLAHRKIEPGKSKEIKDAYNSTAQIYGKLLIAKCYKTTSSSHTARIQLYNYLSRTEKLWHKSLKCKANRELTFRHYSLRGRIFNYLQDPFHLDTAGVNRLLTEIGQFCLERMAKRGCIKEEDGNTI